MKYEFDQRVVVQGSPLPQLNGLLGVVRGVSPPENPDEPVHSALSFAEYQDQLFMVEETYLSDAGGSQSARDFHDGDSLEVPKPRDDGK